MHNSQPSVAAMRVLIAGCGDLGGALAQRLLADGFVVHGLRRSHTTLPDGVQPLCGDVTQPQTLAQLAAINPDFLVYCVAADAQTDADYRAQYVDGLRHVLQALGDGARLRQVLFVSSTRVYGQTGDALLDESTPALAGDFGGQRLLQAEQLLGQLPCSTTVLRLSGIYGPGRTRLLEIAAHRERWPRQNAWSNRIHRDDAAAFAAFLIRRIRAGEPVQRCYIVSDSCPVPLHEVLAWLARYGGAHAAGLASQPVAGGKRLSNARMLATGFTLRYPDYRAGYAALLAR
jgi:nucleoside-diphosphate-sugar epimerase